MKRVKAVRTEETKPKGKSRFALKQRQPIEASHKRHTPPVSGCRLCKV